MDIISVKEPNIAVRVSQYPNDNKKEFLLVGRSNVGKSSFINTLVERKNFAHTSSKPGKTQTLNFYLVNDTFYLVDVPGYGYANVSKEKQKITVDLIQQTFGVISLQDISRIFELLNENKIEEFNTYFNDYLNRGLDTNILINKILNQIYLEEIKIKNGNHSFISLENLKKLANEIVNCYNKKDGLILIKIILLSYFPNKNTTETLSPELIDSNNNQPTQEIIKKEEKSQNSDENEKIESEPKNSTDLLNLQAIRINNAFAEASKESKQEFLKNWDDFKKKIELDNKIELLSIIEDTSIEVASSKNVIFSNSSKSGTIIFNENLHEIEKEFNKKNKSKYKFICLDQEKWTEEKLDYIKNKNTKEYKYIDEETIINNHNSINEAFDIFENDIIEVN